MRSIHKKAAIELSISTIVIIVLAVVMLILGIVLVRSMMCSAIQLTEDINGGVKNQVKTLFGADKLGVKCEGEGSQDVQVGSGGKRSFVCIIKTDAQAEYTLTVREIKSLSGASDAIVQKWVLQDGWSGSITAGGDGEEAVPIIFNIPRDAPRTILYITIDAENKDTGTKETRTSTIEIVPVGWFKTTLC